MDDDGLSAALERIPSEQLADVREQLTILGATSKREGRRETASFYAAVFRFLQREEQRRLRESSANN